MYCVGERKCALQSSAYCRLKDAFDNRKEAIATLTAEKKAVWVLGDEVPEEVILAAGFVPVRISGYYGPRPNADRYLELSFGALWRGIFETIMNGEYGDMMEYLVMSNSSDIILKLYYYLREIRRTEPERKLPTMDFIDYSLIPMDFRSQERNLHETEAFIDRMGQWAGRPVSSESLYEACRIMNEYRQALRRFSALRYGKNSRLLGSEAITAIGGSFYLEKEEATTLLNRLAEEASEWEPVTEVPVYYTGSMQETREVYELLEQSGLNVISEDKIFGDRYADADVDLNRPVVRALSVRYCSRFPSSERSYIRRRAEALVPRIGEVDAAAMVLFMNHNDESYIWDLPRQKQALDPLGIPVLTVEDQYYPLRNKEELLQRFAVFAKEVR